MRSFAASLVAAALVLSSTSSHAHGTPSYEEGAPVPAGYHVEERSRYGLAIVGGAMLAGGATLFTYGYISHRNAVEENERSEDPRALQNPGSGGSAMMWGGVILGVASAPFLILGLTKKKVIVADDVDVVPVVTPGFSGLSLSATF